MPHSLQVLQAKWACVALFVDLYLRKSPKQVYHPMKERNKAVVPTDVCCANTTPDRGPDATE